MGREANSDGIIDGGGGGKCFMFGFAMRCEGKREGRRGDKRDNERTQGGGGDEAKERKDEGILSRFENIFVYYVFFHQLLLLLAPLSPMAKGKRDESRNDTNSDTSNVIVYCGI